MTAITINGCAVKTVLEDNVASDATKTLIVAEQQKIEPNENQHYPFIVRQIKNHLWRTTLPFNYSKSCAEIRAIQVILPYNQKIQQIADQSIQFLKNYHAIHIRRGDILPMFIALNYYTSVNSIKKKLNKVVAKNTRLFVMSNERKPGYFDALKEHYDVYFWRDIPAMKLVIGEHITDNFFLFAIEKIVWNGANLKINTIRRDSSGSDCFLYPDFLRRISSNKLVRLWLALLNKMGL